MADRPNTSTLAIRMFTSVILAVIFALGIVNFALGHWWSALYETALGGGFLLIFAVQWIHLHDMATQRRQRQVPLAPNDEL